MTESGFNLPKGYASQMVDDIYKGDMKNVKTIFNGENYKSGNSLRDMTTIALRDFHNEMSPALKRMHSTYLNNVVANCYPHNHISDDFTNEEQIKLCRADQHREVFGKWNEQYKNHR